MSPYVKLYVSGKQFQTPVKVFKGKNPIWHDCKFEAEITKSKVVPFSVWNKRGLTKFIWGDDLVGSGEINLDKFLVGGKFVEDV